MTDDEEMLVQEALTKEEGFGGLVDSIFGVKSAIEAYIALNRLQSSGKKPQHIDETLAVISSLTGIKKTIEHNGYQAIVAIHDSRDTENTIFHPEASTRVKTPHYRSVSLFNSVKDC